MKIITARTSFVYAAVCLSLSAGTLLPTPVRAASTAHVLGKKGDDDSDKKDSTKPPFNGMTKAQALRFYGEPDSVGHRDGEELWTYVLNRGSSIGKSFIPFGVNSKLRFRLLTFKDGKVVKYRWDAPDKAN